jgi:hypothetical protein
VTSWKFVPLWLSAWYIVWVGLVILFAFAIPTGVAYLMFLLPIVAALVWKLRNR